MSRDYYEILGVPREASQDDVKRAYRRLARELHPDANQTDADAEERFKEVNRAYETLKDPERRRRYDMFGPEGAEGGADFGAGFGGGFGDIFEAFFGGGSFSGSPFGSRSRGRYPSGTAPGEDIGVEVRLSFVEAVYGAETTVDVTTLVLCETCEGSGAAQGTHPESCATCRGRGEVQEVRRTVLGQIVTAHPCPTCRGTGITIAVPCDACHGQGRVSSDQSLTLKIPAGIEHGAQLRLSGRGDLGYRGGAAGDLYVRIRVDAAPAEWSREGPDLRFVLHVPATTAALGGVMSVPSLDGSEEIRVDVMPGTATGTVQRFRGKGGPRMRGGGSGDLYVDVFVDTPTAADEEQEALLRRLAELRSENVETPGVMSRIKNAFR
ncbi:MAG: J domain-containing protein [Acidimicrobiia bacterium]|nr:J domain-containing protein [Acidimicrobiia bacterium]